MDVNEVLIQLVRRNVQISEQIMFRSEQDVKRALEIAAREARHREAVEKFCAKELEKVNEISLLDRSKEFELDCLARDERWADELKRIEKETKDWQLELERIRAIVDMVQVENSLKKVQEEMADLRQKIAAQEDSQRNASNTIQAQSSTCEKRFRGKDEVEEEEEKECGGNIMVKEATSEAEEERHHVRGRSKAKRNALKSPKRRPVVSDDSTDDNEDDSRPLMGSSKTRSARRKLPSAFLRVQEESTDEQEDSWHKPPPPPPKF